jgi:hypothetical protein
MRILVVNAGSSSLKLSLLDDGDNLAGHADLPADRGQFEPDAVADVLGAGESGRRRRWSPWRGRRRSKP